MATASLSTIGLTMAGAMSLTNVLIDVARKRALDGREVAPVTFWTRIVVAGVFGAALAVRVAGGARPGIHDAGELFGIASLELAPMATFLIYLLIDVLLVTACMWLYFRALQLSPLSVCIPFLAFTPVFLIPTGFIVLGEKPPPLKLLGVALIVVGSLMMHRKLFAAGPLEPVRAIFREKGSRYMLAVAFIFSVSNPVEKRLVLMSDPLSFAFAYACGLSVGFFLLSLLLKKDFGAAAKSNTLWIALAGFLDGISLLLQFGSYNYIDVVITVSIKRAGIVLSVFSGWLFFKERGITDKVIAASVMFCGVLVLYLPLTAAQALWMSAATIAAMAVALYVTRNSETPEPVLK